MMLSESLAYALLKHDPASEMTCIVSSGALNSTHSLKHDILEFTDCVAIASRRIRKTS